MLEVYTKLIVSSILSILLLKYTVKVAPRFYTVRFISGYYSFQFIAVLVYLLIDYDAKIWTGSYKGLYLKNYVDEGIKGYFIFQIGALIACAIGKLIFPYMSRRSSLTDLIKSNSTTLQFPLFFTALVLLSYPFLSSVPGLGYANAILFNFLNFIPFVAGVLFFKDKKLRLFWLVALSVLFVMGILTGGRGTAMTCASLYAIGFFYSLESVKARRIALIVGIVVMIPLMSFLSFVGMYRHIVGRAKFTELNWGRVVRMYDKYQKIKDSKVLNLDSEEGRLNGWGRFINYVNFTQFATIPYKKDHLGFKDLIEVDLRYSFDVSFLSGTTQDDRIRARFGNYRLNEYGYLCNKSTSVEYSIVTESYIRFGFLGIFIFSIAIVLFAQCIEFLTIIMGSGTPSIQIFATVMLSQQALLGYAYNLFVIMRNMLVCVFIAFVLITILLAIKKIISFSKYNLESNAG